MNNHDLLLFGRVLHRVAFLLVPKLLLVAGGFGWFWDRKGCLRCRCADSVIDEPLCQLFGTIEGSGV